MPRSRAIIVIENSEFKLGSFPWTALQIRITSGKLRKAVAELWSFTSDLLPFQPKDDSKYIFDNYNPVKIYN